jgi:hypothetical protein
MQGRARRILLLVAAAIGVWYLVVIFSWAARPLHDSVPIGIDPRTNAPVSQDVTCNTLFAGSAHDGPLPPLQILLPLKGGQFVYNRGACSLVQRDARIVFGLDTLGAFAAIGGLATIALRKPKPPAPLQRPAYA